MVHSTPSLQRFCLGCTANGDNTAARAEGGGKEILLEAAGVLEVEGYGLGLMPVFEGVQARIKVKTTVWDGRNCLMTIANESNGMLMGIAYGIRIPSYN